MFLFIVLHYSCVNYKPIIDTYRHSQAQTETKSKTDRKTGRQTERKTVRQTERECGMNKKTDS